ncbi:hypothetical protein MJI20_30920, partial [Salmonella enterica subsp. enterica serovar Anatum]|nr:hypothetical protein [Salmonella enterica subsp. enterica serovar Anatum]
HKIAGVVVFNTDYLIISVFLGITVITSFSSYMMLIQALAFLIQINTYSATENSYKHISSLAMT